MDCYSSKRIDPVTPDFTWEIVRPIPLTSVTGSGTVATVAAEWAGDYSCTFTATADRDCPPDPLDVGPETKTLTFTATVSLDPSTIAATTSWPDIPADVNESDISVTWNPPECVGHLAIVELEGTGGYVPRNEGALTKESDTVWPGGPSFANAKGGGTMIGPAGRLQRR